MQSTATQGTSSHFTKLIEAAAMVSSGPGNFLTDEGSVTLYVSQESAGRTIFLADLPRNTSYIDLSEYFEKIIGPCVIQIKRPLFKQFYFAFVQFQTVEHARKVLEEVRYPEIKGVRCRALPYSRPTGGASLSSGAEKKPTTFQLFVKGIPAPWTHHELYENFKPYGRIISAKVSIDGDFKSRGYGFVQFEALDAAQTAIKEMNGKDMNLDDEDNKLETLEPLSVCEFIPKADRNGVQQPKCGTNLYVKNFPENDFGDQELRERFEVFGEIVSAAVMLDAATGLSKGFGFVSFKCWQDAQKALDELKGAVSSVEGDDNKDPAERKIKRGLYVREAKTKEQRTIELQKSTYQFKKSMQLLNLVVKNVDPSTTKPEFEEFFGNFGQVNNSKLNTESQLGFVCFQDRESARNAKENAPRQLFKNRRLIVNFCEPRESRRISLEEQFDKRAYQRQRVMNVRSQNSDLLTLINSIGLLLNFSGNGVQGGQLGANATAPQQNFGGANNGYRSQSYQRHNNNGQQRQFQPNTNYNGNNFQQRQGGFQNRGQQRGGSLQPGAYQQRPQHFQQHQQQMPQQVQPPSNAPPGPFQISPQFPFPVAQPQPQMELPQVSPEMQFALNYAEEIKQMFMSSDFKESQQQQRREMVGSAIYKYVEQMLGPEVSPKITGMIIDLPPQDLNMSVLQYHLLQQKVRTALQLLVDSNTLQKPLVAKAQAFLHSAPHMQTGGNMHAPNVPQQQVMTVQQDATTAQ